MDVVTQLTARAAAYLDTLQSALCLLPAPQLGHPTHLPKLLELEPTSLLRARTQQAGQEVPGTGGLLWEHLCATPALLLQALVLSDPPTYPVDIANAAAGEQLPHPDRFRQQAVALLEFLQQQPELPALLADVLKTAPRTVARPPEGALQALVRKSIAAFARLVPIVGTPTRLLAPVLPCLPPECWRRLLRALLYQQGRNRHELAARLQFLPTLVGQASSAEYAALQKSKGELTQLQTQRKPAGDLANLVQQIGRQQAVLQQRQYQLLTNDDDLEAGLVNARCALPFALVFRRELAEVTTRRKGFGLPHTAQADPQHCARDLHLCGVAFSGGGIRSATFNLGILQGLASKGWLPQVDYLSAVSGGSYIAAWFAAWIKREGSLPRVEGYLCPITSPDPKAEEARPLRWLRMYSNYLAPKASIMSTDAWTIGMTWLRNTLLTQLTIVLALSAVLALETALFRSWELVQWRKSPDTWQDVVFVAALSVALLLPGALLASVGMRMFRQNYQWRTSKSLVTTGLAALLLPGAFLTGLGMAMFRAAYKWRSNDVVPALVSQLLLLALIGGLLASSLLFKVPYPGFFSGALILWPAGVVGVLALLLVAIGGHYDRCFYQEDEDYRGWPRRRWQAWAWIGVYTTLAACLGLAGLVGVWKLLDVLRSLSQPLPAYPGFWVMLLPEGLLHQPHGALLHTVGAVLVGSHNRMPPVFFSTLAFVVGLPLVLEALVLTVVTRMALLGTNFPDERREWWGRMGAVLHLALVSWIVLTSSTVLARILVHLFAGQVAAKVAVTGGWLTFVGWAVRFAFSARTAAKSDQPGTSSWLDWVLQAAPYVFAFGMLMACSEAVYWLLHQQEAPTSVVYQVLATFPRLLEQARAWLFAITEWPLFGGRTDPLFGQAVFLAGMLGLLAWVLATRMGVNEFSLHHFYRNRLERSYLGASRRRAERVQTANPFTGFDRRDDVKLCSLRQTDPLPSPTGYDGPYLIINAALNATHVTDLAQQDRKAESFVFTPYYCGFDFARLRSTDSGRPSFEFGYRPTQEYAYPDDNGPSAGTAMAISGAAANPNEGYHSSPATAFLLTLFNVRLGWWIGNPSADCWRSANPRLGLLYLLKDLFGRSDTDDNYVNLSDGGHFDNMGLYELVRRRCRYIILGDGEEDHGFTCEGLANAIRRCRIDFGVEISINVRPITNRNSLLSDSHHAVGTIHYPEDPPGTASGYLLYLKTSLTGDEPSDVREYALADPAFPHQSTGDQFFSEPQFESYRRLGLHAVHQLSVPRPSQGPVRMPDLFAFLLAEWQAKEKTWAAAAAKKGV
ncbi:patatin-like phospholipase family protein [Hymenobacter sp. BT491]|uniref:patatin-like phospholipase family protein n=1 Tax=Hymenobacter sp. BT491 TaxID=2766779 RepID=UPI001653CB95|nr:patatin-like phospholipase family protein [Hymenobacter sp. BT491]MBC6992330.1 patatin-like phospholipase family protein [Hymenobacter sp. BT491]